MLAIILEKFKRKGRPSKLWFKKMDGSRGAEINELQKEINELLDEEKTRWRQRSRVQWLQKGDRNTQYYHYKASQQKKKNEIRGL